MAVPKFVVKKIVKKVVKSVLKKQEMKSNIYKMIPSDAKGLLSMVKTDKGKAVVTDQFGYTKMPDGSEITMMSDLKSHCYNSKKKKK